PAEWRVLDPLCRVTISRFYRDRSVFQSLEREVLPRLARNTGARGGRVLRCWSVGCASGEEPYTLAMLWRFAVKRRFPGIGLQIIATDPDEGMLERAWAGCYPASSLWELPEDRVRRGFTRRGKLYCIRDIVKADVEFRAQDVRRTMPDGPFDLVLCRNIVFTYFDEELQRQIMKEFRQRIVPGGILVTGVHEPLPLEKEGFIPLPGTRGIYLSVEQDQDA
ncbi:MAG TPA: CheR family methyltransferase, partial [Nitrospirota bacterium]|nr:CheR family methyltransferase [Nitrospirota bacterium]